MHANEGDELREQLFRDGYVVLERFWTKNDLDVLQLEAETTLEAAGAYEDDSSGQGGREAGAMRRRGCVFEVLRPFPDQPCPAGALPAGAAAGGMAPHVGSMTGPGPGPGPSPSAVQLPSLGLLASPRLHALLRSVLGATPAADRAACAAACSGQRPDRGAEQAGTAGPSEGSAAGRCEGSDGGSGGSTVGGGCEARGAAGAAQGASGPEGRSGRGDATGPGGGPFLFNEQFIVKPPRSSAACAFAMHRDSDWCRGRPEFRYSRYVSAWTAVDDMTAENGPLLVVPGSHLEPQDSAWRGAGPAAVAGSCRAPEGAEHPASAERQAELGELQLQEAQCGVGRRRVDEAARCCAGVGARGGGEQEDRLGEAGAGTAEARGGGGGGGGGGAATAPVSGAGGDATLGGGAAGAGGAGVAAGGGRAEAPPRRAVHLLVPAGTMVLFADTLLHGSGPNRSRHMRRAWMPQFSCQPITRWGGSESGACGVSTAPVALAVPLAALADGGKAQRP